MRIAFKTFGCRANTLDTDALFLEAKRRGHEVVDEAEVADAYVINSCTVTSAADRDARSHVIRYKRKNPKALVGVVGCYAQVAKEELLRLSQVDFVVGTADKQRILDLLDHGGERDQVAPARGYLPEHFPGSRNARAAIKIQDGCNYSCSFCIIPRARGRSRSLPVETVLKQVEEAYAQGFQEVVLTGIHLAHYGWDHGIDLMGLLGQLISRPEGPRIRLSTLDPFEIPDNLIAMVGKEPRLCPHFHIAIQSGSDAVLAGMRRIYQAKEFAEVTQKIQAQNPDTFIGVDVIVGFPGEDDKEFEETEQLLASTFWAKLHVFPFSERRGTRATTLPGKVAASTIADRSTRLRALSARRYQGFLESQVGKSKKVLLERPSKEAPALWLGHTENYIPTVARLESARAKQIIDCTLERLDGDRVWAIPAP